MSAIISTSDVSQPIDVSCSSLYLVSGVDSSDIAEKLVQYERIEYSSATQDMDRRIRLFEWNFASNQVAPYTMLKYCLCSEPFPQKPFIIGGLNFTGYL